MRSVFSAYGSAWLWVSTVMLVIMTAVRTSAIGLPRLTVTDRLITLVPALQHFVTSRPAASLFSSVVFAPLFEEAIFRMLPLSLALVLAGLLHDKFAHHGRNLIRAVLFVVCCLIFGLAHGSVLNIFIQGVVGLVLGRLYLRHSDNQFKAYAACVMVHAMYNFTVFASANIG